MDIKLMFICFSLTIGLVITKGKDLYNDEDLMIYDQSTEAGNCSEGFTFISDSCFYFQEEDVNSWQDAVLFCKSLSAKLAVLNDCNLFSDVVAYLNNLNDAANYYWIGASDEGEEGAWFWIDFTPVTLGPPYWGSAGGIPEPAGGADQNCVYLFKGDRYRFHDGYCNGNCNSLCQKDPF